MFLEAERWLPSRDSIRLIEKVSIKPEGETGAWEKYLFDHGRRFAFDIDYTRRFVPRGSRILDVGARPYFLAKALAELDYGVTVTDVSPASGAERALLNADFLKCNLDFDEIPADADSFDAVICNEVFEHLRFDLIHSVRELLGVLKPGGRLFLSTPNLRSVSGLYNLIVKGEAYSCIGDIYSNFSDVQRGKGQAGHVREYTPKELIVFLRKVGLDIDGVIYRSRGCYTRNQKIQHYITASMPSLRPFFSIVASKPIL